MIFLYGKCHRAGAVSTLAFRRCLKSSVYDCALQQDGSYVTSGKSGPRGVISTEEIIMLFQDHDGKDLLVPHYSTIHANRVLSRGTV